MIVGLLALSTGIVFAADTINCSVVNSKISHCTASYQEADVQAQNIKIIREIDLNPVIKSFRKLISKQLNKKTCEKKVFVKGAKLTVNGELLVIDIRARLTRQYCTRRAKLLVYEKTNGINYSLLPVVDETGIHFIVQNLSPNHTSFEKSFTEVEDMNIKKKINLALSNLLGLPIENIKLSIKPTLPIVFKSAVISSNTNVLTLELSTSNK